MNIPKTPIIIEKIIKFLLALQPNIYPKAAILLTIAKFMQILNYKRLKFETCFGTRITNIFALVFLPSGGGKDLTCKNLENFVFQPVFEAFREKSKEEYKKDLDKLQKKYFGKKIPQSERNKNFPIALESQNATPEGLKKIADFLDTKDFGGIFLFVSELAYIFSGNKGVELFYYLLGCYDGKISGKSIKSDNQGEAVNNISISFLGFSDPERFFNNTNIDFNALLATGLARRTFLIFQPKLAKNVFFAAERAFIKHAKSKAEKLSKEVQDIIDCLEYETVFNVTNTAYDNVFVKYKQNCLQKSENMENAHMQKEIKDRPLKALNIAALYAVLSHPSEKVIKEQDIEQAIETVEYLSTDLEKFLNYTPQKHDLYQQFFEFLKRNKNKAFAKTELITKYYSDTGFSRKILRKDFDEIVSIVKEIAEMNDLTVETSFFHNNIGKKIMLKDKVQPVENCKISHISPVDNTENVCVS